jgi:thiamine-monophosphate kinase
MSIRLHGLKSLAVACRTSPRWAQPAGFTLALALPSVDEDWLGAFSRGLLDLAARHDCELLGGDTTRGPLAIGITIFGHVPPEQALRRDRGRAGDDLWVSGELGSAALAVRERLAGRALPAEHPARARLERPSPRVALGRSLLGLAHAAIDLSDGLLGDLGHLCERSGLGARIEWPRVPLAGHLAALPMRDRMALALAGGDDYELLFSAPGLRETISRLTGEGGPVCRSAGLTSGGIGSWPPTEPQATDEFSIRPLPLTTAPADLAARLPAPTLVRASPCAACRALAGARPGQRAVADRARDGGHAGAWVAWAQGAPF